MPHLHHPLAIHSEEPAAKLLQLYRSQGQGPPLAGRFLLQFNHFGKASSETTLKNYDHCHPIEKAMTSPRERNIDILPPAHDFEAPKLLRYEILDSKVPIDDETQGWELT